MSKNHSFVFCTFITLTSALSVTTGAVQSFGDQKVSINVAIERRSGEKTRGPVTVTLTRVNVLRYDVIAGVSVTFTGGPDLRVPFIPAIPAPAAASPPATPKPGEGGAISLAPTPGNLLQRLGIAEADRLTKVQRAIDNATITSNAAKQSVDALVLASDGALRTLEGAAQLVDASKSSVTKINDSLTVSWPAGDILTQLVAIASIRNDLNGLTNIPATEQPVRDYIAARLSVLEAWYATVSLQSEVARAAGDAQAKLATWKPILESIVRSGLSAFTIPAIRVDCGFSFGGTKESKVELIKRDRLAAPGLPEAREEIVTVVCSSPMSISGGFGLSDADKEVVGIEPAVKTVTENGETTVTTVSKFGLIEKSTYRTMPLLLVHTRVYEPNDLFSVHVTAGTAVGTDGSPGVDVDYVFGGSVAIKRQLFVSAGWFLATKNVLSNQFAQGQEVPSGVTVAPTQKQRLRGFILAFTFKLR